MNIKSRLIITIVVALLIGAALIVTRTTQTHGKLRAAFDGEFMTRPDGFQEMCKHYGMNFKVRPLEMEYGLMFRAIHDKAVDVIDSNATDGRIPAYNLVVLEDDKHFFPPYYAAPVIRAETLKKHPELKKILNRLAGRFTAEVMQQMNYEVDKGGKRPEGVALEFLIENNLIPDNPKQPLNPKDTITIGGKNFNEQEILGHIMKYMIEHYSNLKVDFKLNLGGTMIVFNAIEAGDIDIYPEYTGTGLLNILKENVITDPDAAYDRVKSEFRSKYDLVWLESFGFDNSWAILMRKEDSEKHKIATISDLADYMHSKK